MFLDKLLELDPAGTAITVTAVSTNVLDGLAVRDLGIGASGGEPLEFVITVTTAFAAAGAGTLQISVQGSVDNITWTDYIMTAAIGKASLTAGTQIKIPMPTQAAAPQAAGLPRFYRLNYTVATGPFTAGVVSAYLVPCAQPANVSYAPGFTVAN